MAKKKVIDISNAPLPAVPNPEQLKAIAVKAMMEKVLSTLDHTQKTMGEAFADDVAYRFLSSLIGALAYTALTVKLRGGLSEEDKMLVVQQSFANAKSNIQSAAAAGVAGAMTIWSGRHNEYYCQIKPVPEPINKLPS